MGIIVPHDTTRWQKCNVKFRLYAPSEFLAAITTHPLLGEGEPFVSGTDAPETSRAKCDQERKLGNEAKQRLSQLLKTPGIKIEDLGVRDTTQQKRPLVRLRLPDGRFAETIMIQEGYAVVWTPGYKRTWCG